MGASYRNILIKGFTFLGGIYFFLEFVLPKQIETVFGIPLGVAFEFGRYHDQISRGIQVIGAMAIGLGIINIVKVHGANILKTKKGWGNSFALLLGFVIVVVVQSLDLSNAETRLYQQQYIRGFSTFVTVVHKEHTEEQKPAAPRLRALAEALEQTRRQTETPHSYLSFKQNEEQAPLQAAISEAITSALAKTDALITVYDTAGDSETLTTARSALVSDLKKLAELTQELTTIRYEETTAKRGSSLFFGAFFDPLGAAMFSLLAFYIANAAYRSFRVKSLEASVMMLAALIVMLGQIPFGPLYIYDDLPAVRVWLLKNVNAPAFRAIYFGSAIAGLAMAVRMWLSLEKSPLADESTAEEEKRGGV